MRLVILGVRVTQTLAIVQDLPTTADDHSDVMAAVDLGSNSFHMVVARLDHGQLVIVDRLREMVRLAAGLTKKSKLDTPSQNRAHGCLQRFGERLREMHAHQVRVVGTNTLRKARNAHSFLRMAEEALEHPVEIISGMEEARLIFVGVSHHAPSDGKPILVLDIGGGSTELIIGEGHEPTRLESLSMGCVAWSERHFPGGRFKRSRFDRARLATRLELQPIAERFKEDGWGQAIGSSGTIRAAERIARALELTEAGLTVDALEAIVECMLEAGSVDQLALPELSVERAPVFSGGVVILVETMKALEIAQLQVSEGALREGLLYDMLGRLRHEDARERTIRAIQSRYNIDQRQAERVTATALQLLREVRRDWHLKGRQYRTYLAWAAQFHEIGLDIAHDKYHHHGGYLVANAYLPGFASFDQRVLSELVAHHRHKIEDFDLSELSEKWREKLPRLLVILRLAVLLNRSRSSAPLPRLALRADGRRLRLSFPVDWLDHSPLTKADLRQEMDWLRSLGIKLVIDEADVG